MTDLHLFLGFCPDSLFNRHQKKANPHLVSLLTSGGDYLQQISHKKKTYLGKKTAVPLSLEELILLEANIISLLKKWVPEYPYTSNPLVLLSISEK